MNVDSTRWDPGLQPERTTLAWLRTTLSFLVGGLVMIRFVAHHSLAGAVAAVAMMVPLAALLTGLAAHRHRHTQHNLRTDVPLPDGRAPAALTVLAVVVGCAGLFVVLA